VCVCVYVCLFVCLSMFMSFLMIIVIFENFWCCHFLMFFFGIDSVMLLLIDSVIDLCRSLCQVSCEVVPMNV